jgi:hypothetical protein
MITPRPYQKLLLRILSASLFGLMSGTAVTQDLVADTVGASPPPLTSDQLREDIGFVFTTIEQVHPHPYYSVAREVILQRKTALLQTASTPQTLAEFYRDIAAFVNTYDDGHTRIVRPPGVPSLKPPVHRLYPWKFTVLPDGIGYLDFVSMGNRPKWQKFLEQTFASIHDQKLTGLIIDLRANSGGDSQLGDDLLAYLTDKPYRPIASKAWRFSAPYVAQMNPVDPWGFVMNVLDVNQAPPPDAQALLAQRPTKVLRTALHERSPTQTRRILERHAPHWLETGPVITGESETLTLTITGNPIVPPAEMPLRFRGSVVFLIGPDTFSSAVILADIVDTFKVAPLIGEETKPCNQFGEPCFVDLPHSRLRLGIATAQFVRANGDASSRRGVIPAIPVNPSHRDSDLSRDGVVLRAQDYLRQSQIRP